VQILTQNSRLYGQPENTQQQLVNLFDSTIPLLTDGKSTVPGSPGTTNNPGVVTNPGTSGSGSLDSSGSSTGTSTNTGKSVAIGIGAAVAAICYAALMFFGAKRFRRQSAQAQSDRRQHSRVSSITGERAPSPYSDESHRSSRGSGGRAVKGQNISAPLMTENSLLL